MPSSPSQRTFRTTWENGLPTTPTAAYLAAEGISPTTGPGREGKEKAQVFEPVRQHMVCVMKCGGDPTQPTFHHQPSLVSRCHRTSVEPRNNTAFSSSSCPSPVDNLTRLGKNRCVPSARCIGKHSWTCVPLMSKRALRITTKGARWVGSEVQRSHPTWTYEASRDQREIHVDFRRLTKAFR